jgi:AcrR family transcriptional regulator
MIPVSSSKEATSRRAAGSRRRRHSDEALLDAARTVFARSGFEAASMAAVAGRAGATKPTLYERFGSKKELYEQAVQRDADALVDHLFAEYSAVADGPVGAMVDASMAAYFDFFAARPDAFGLLFSSGRSEPAVVMAERVLETITDRLAEMVGTVLARTGRAPAARTRLLAAMLLGIAHHGVAAARHDPALDAAEAQRLASDLALSGLRELRPESFGRPD